MKPQTVEQHDHFRTDFAWLENRVRTWIEAGLITAEEGAAVQDFERRADARSPRSALGLPAEVVAYVGIVLALAGALVGLRPHWDATPLVAQFALAMVVAVVGFACGTWLVGLAETGTRRLGMFLWVLGSAGVALGSIVGALSEHVRQRHRRASRACFGRRALKLVQVVDVGVGPWKEQAHVPGIAPADSERWLSIGTCFENLCVTLRFPDSMRPDHDPITHFSSHDPSPDLALYHDHLAESVADVGPNVMRSRSHRRVSLRRG